MKPKPTHPSELILEEIAERGWTLEDLARKMTMEDYYPMKLLALQIYCDPAIRNEHGTSITFGSFATFAKIMGTSMEFWTNAETLYRERYNEWQAEQPPDAEGDA